MVAMFWKIFFQVHFLKWECLNVFIIIALRCDPNYSSENIYIDQSNGLAPNWSYFITLPPLTKSIDIIQPIALPLIVYV